MSTVTPHVFTQDEITGEAYTRDFIAKFLPGRTGMRVLTANMEELIAMYVEDLEAAKARWSSLNVGGEIAEMDHWLCERGYMAPDYRAD